MALLRTIVFIAALSGLVAGLAMTAMQAFATVPLILAAEAYEGAAEAHAHAPGTAAHGHDEGWAPEEGFERLLFTALANIVAGVGLGLVLVAAGELAGGLRGWRRGALWGLAGFAAFVLAPGIGLPPELPAMPAADLAARQAWWAGTVAATAAGLALLLLRRSPAPALLGAGLILLPHVLGAPQPESHASPVPTDLHRDFVVAVTATSFVFWLLLGGVAGALRGRFAG